MNEEIKASMERASEAFADVEFDRKCGRYENPEWRKKARGYFVGALVWGKLIEAWARADERAKIPGFGGAVLSARPSAFGKKW